MYDEWVGKRRGNGRLRRSEWEAYSGMHDLVRVPEVNFAFACMPCFRYRSVMDGSMREVWQDSSLQAIQSCKNREIRSVCWTDKSERMYNSELVEWYLLLHVQMQSFHSTINAYDKRLFSVCKTNVKPWPWNPPPPPPSLDWNPYKW